MSGTDLARRQRVGGVENLRGGCEWALGAGWTVELTLNRKRKENCIPTGGATPLTPPPSRSATVCKKLLYIK